VAKKTKVVRQLVNHRDVARMFGTSPSNWRRWASTGQVPLPHKSIGTMLLYDRAEIDYRLETGRWPEGARSCRARGQIRFLAHRR
jgi:hypothetical protein